MPLAMRMAASSSSEGKGDLHGPKYLLLRQPRDRGRPRRIRRGDEWRAVGEVGRKLAARRYLRGVGPGQRYRSTIPCCAPRSAARREVGNIAGQP